MCVGRDELPLVDSASPWQKWAEHAERNNNEMFIANRYSVPRDRRITVHDPSH